MTKKQTDLDKNFNSGQVRLAFHPETGHKFCLVRGRDAGVFAGYVADIVGDSVRMIDSRNLWEWSGAFSLSEIAVAGVLHAAASRLTTTVKSQRILGVCQILDCTVECFENLKAIPDFVPS